MSIRPRVRQLAAYDFAAQSQRVKLDQNELPWDVPGELKEEILERVRMAELNRYPELQAETLAARLAELHDWPVQGVVVAPGSNVLIQCFVIAAGIGQGVLVPSPSFSVYGLQATLLAAPLTEVPLRPDFSLPVEALQQAMSEGVGVLFVANPAAPTAKLHPLEELERLVGAARDRWTVVVDEAYHEFAGSDFRELARQPHVASLRTLSKAVGLAGARLGFALMQPQLAEQVRKTVNPFAVSALQQAAALAVLDHPELVERRVAEVVAERERLLAGLRRLEAAQPFASVTNFVLVRFVEAERVYRELLRRGIAVRRQRLPGLDGCLRVSVGRREENDAVLEALSEILGEPGDG